MWTLKVNFWRVLSIKSSMQKIVASGRRINFEEKN
jgi:hypothetical protein